MAETDFSFFGRLWLALLVFFRIVFDPAFARRSQSLNDRTKDHQPVPPEANPEEEPVPEVTTSPRETPNARTPDDGALGLLALFQREGRFVDFLEQEIASFADAEIGAAARVVHDGCRKALHAHVEIVRVRDEAEGSAIVLPEGFDGASVKLTGNVTGHAPYRGVLRHSGWRVRQVKLPVSVAGHDSAILAPAEIEL